MASVGALHFTKAYIGLGSTFKTTSSQEQLGQFQPNGRKYPLLKRVQMFEKQGADSYLGPLRSILRTKSVKFASIVLYKLILKKS